MRTTFAFTALLASLSTVLALTPRQKDGFIGKLSNSQAGHNATNGKQMVMLYKIDGTENRDIQKALDLAGMDADDVSHWYNNTQFVGFSAIIGEHCIEAFKAMADIAYVEEAATIKTFAQKTGAPWGLQRISSDAGASGNPQGQNFVYTFDDEQLGAGVDIYVVDTGVRTSHAVFGDGNGGSRATEGFSFTGSVADGDGHGTHVAGTVGGLKFGVAQNANIIAVKVLGDDGSGSSADTISGMDWIINRHNERKAQSGFKGSIMSMSWGLQGTAATVDEVVLAASNAGIHISVAAGNDGADACQSTPSHNGGANSAVVSVGSVNIDNQVSEFSNIGTCVDVYAPGEQVLSSWATGDTVINFLSGTSMACPHVSGVMAYMLAQDDSLATDPAALKAKLLQTARQNAFTGNIGGSDNLLLSNGANGSGSTRRLMKNWVVPDNGANTGSPASQARSIVNNVDKRWEVHSVDSPVRY